MVTLYRNSRRKGDGVSSPDILVYSFSEMLFADYLSRIGCIDPDFVRIFYSKFAGKVRISGSRSHSTKLPL